MARCMNATCCCLCIVKLLLTPVTTHEKLHRLCVYTSVHHLLYQNVLHFVLSLLICTLISVVYACPDGASGSAAVRQLDNRTYGARHARVRPTVCHAVCISHQRNSGSTAEQVKYRGTRPLQFPPTFPPLTLIYTSLSKRERSHSIYTKHTPSAKPDDVTQHYTCPTPEVMHWASPLGRPQHWYVKGAHAT